MSTSGHTPSLLQSKWHVMVDDSEWKKAQEAIHREWKKAESDFSTHPSLPTDSLGCGGADELDEFCNEVEQASYRFGYAAYLHFGHQFEWDSSLKQNCKRAGAMRTIGSVIAAPCAMAGFMARRMRFADWRSKSTPWLKIVS